MLADNDMTAYVPYLTTLTCSAPAEYVSLPTIIIKNNRDIAYHRAMMFPSHARTCVKLS